MTVFMMPTPTTPTMPFATPRRPLAAALACLALAAPACAKDVALRPWPAGQATPALALSDLDGKPFDAGLLRGKVVVLNFWATWCGPCVAELPVLGRLAARDGVAVVGVNYKEGLPAIRAFTAAHPIPYPVLRDRDGAAFAQWSPGVMPTTILLDRQGRARWRTVGEIPADDARLAQAIDALLAEPAGKAP
jgi:cytochrome c biogenesis protein CcmG, thiol:disulfide interchange protein DsbE